MVSGGLKVGGITVGQFLDFYCLDLDCDPFLLHISFPLLGQAVLFIVQRHSEQQLHSGHIAAQFLKSIPVGILHSRVVKLNQEHMYIIF